jgi:lysophospholipase L1-like esterase
MVAVNPTGRRAFLAGLGALVVAGCSSTRTGTAVRPEDQAPVDSVGPAPTAITSVVIVGDSITEGSAAALNAALRDAGVDDVRIEGKASRRIEVGNGKGSGPESGILTVSALLAEGADPSVWVIELGTNDVGGYASADEYGALIDKILDLLPPAAPLVWVNTYRAQYLDDTLVFNQELQQRITERGNAVVADWYSIASAPDQTILRSDRLHPNESGQVVLSWLVLAALQQL